MRRLKWLGGLALAALMLWKSGAAAQGAARAMACWYASVAPALFPFLALMPLLTCREASLAYERLLGKPVRALFDLPGAAAPAMVVGMLAGAPAGALAFRDVAARSKLTRGQLTRGVMAFTGFSPAFLIGGIGAGLLGSAGLGWKLLEAQLLTQMTVALLTRRAWRNRTDPVPAVRERDEAQPIRRAVLVALNICGYMALFGALCGAAEALAGEGALSAALCLMDVPSGAARLAGLAMDGAVRLTLLAAMCGFGGICVAAQCLGVLRGCGIGAAEYIGMRLLAGAIAAAYMALLLHVPSVGLDRLALSIKNRPYEMAGLVTALLAMPVLLKMRKSVS